ncbi:MAG: ABC transporter permease [Treponema sp.]|nr:ABC transporter permease [Treponema sp.]
MKEKFVLFLFLITAHFFLPRLMRSDPFLFVSSDGTEITSYSEEEIARYKAYYGLDKPLWQQYTQFIAGLFRGNLGYSIYFKEKVITLILRRLVWTAGIVSVSLLFSVCAGLVFGSISAWYFGKLADCILYRLMVVVSEIPGFLTATAILMLFILRWRVLPTAGGITPFIRIRFSAAVVGDIAAHAVLPSLTLSLLKTPVFYFTVRSALIRQLAKKYTETARAKSLRPFYIVQKHCLPNAANPIITQILLSIQTLFNGALIVETVFKYPGIGNLIRDAVFNRDYILLQGIFFVITVFILLTDIFGDLLYKKTAQEATVCI